MIVLDANVLSELMKPREQRSSAVMAFMSRYPRSESYITAVTLAEILLGIEIKPAGRRRDELSRSADVVIGQFADRVLAFDQEAARTYALLWAERRRKGRHCAAFDLQIAAITLANGMALATRNISDFADCGLSLVDPWAAPLQDTP